jgi:hypothetical protein
MDLFALATLPTAADEAGGPPSIKFYELRDNLDQRARTSVEAMGMCIQTVIEHALRNAEERLATLSPASPVYAVALFSHDPEELAAGNITLGLERDRETALRTLEQEAENLTIAAYRERRNEALWRVWNAAWFGAAAPNAPQLVLTDDAFVAAQEAATKKGIWDPQRYVLNRVAARLQAAEQPFAVTDDFVAYAYTTDDEVLEENVRFSASPAAVAAIERKGLF